jgi:DNA-directed RNA polymerase specialized sigma24 family protein
VRAGRASSIPPAEVQFVFDWLALTLARSYGFVESDAGDAAQDAIVSLLEAAGGEDSPVDRIRNPAAYLTWLARNRAIDRLRGRAYEAPADFEEHPHAPHGRDDERIAALLDRSATASVIEAAMRTALEAHDGLAVRVVTAWLDTAEALGKPPSSREVAKRAGVSHTSVNAALRRFRSYFPDQGPRSSHH